jgi:hypothetical protein
VSLEGFADAVFSGVSVSGQIWHHLLGWWRLRHQPTVLWVCFEDMIDNLATEVARVAEFLCVGSGEASDALVRATSERCTLKAMTAPESAHHWDDHFVRSHVLPRMRVPGANKSSSASGGSGNSSASGSGNSNGSKTGGAVAAGGGATAAPRVSKVRREGGRVGQRVPQTLRAQLDAKWDAIIRYETGLRDYAHLRETLARERAEAAAARALHAGKGE